jgi:stage V sporulation protein G
MSQITEVQIKIVKPHEGLVAFASIILDDKLYLSSIGIFSKLDGSGYRITYPTKKVGDTNLQIFHPITRELSELIESAVINKFEKLIDEEVVI